LDCINDCCCASHLIPEAASALCMDRSMVRHSVARRQHLVLGNESRIAVPEISSVRDYWQMMCNQKTVLFTLPLLMGVEPVETYLWRTATLMTTETIDVIFKARSRHGWLLEEGPKNTTCLIVKCGRYTLDSSAASKTANRGLCDPFNIVAGDFEVTTTQGMLLTKLEDGSPRTEQVDFVTVGKVRVNLLSDANLAILPRRLEFLPRAWRMGEYDRSPEGPRLAARDKRSPARLEKIRQPCNTAGMFRRLIRSSRGISEQDDRRHHTRILTTDET
ncbi:hypothetical protein KCU95_g84, partial [Aureobasidium melanogenum]